MNFSPKSTITQVQIVAIVIFVTVVLWIGLQWLGGYLGLAGKYAFLFDFFAIAAFAWALITLIGIWRSRR